MNEALMTIHHNDPDKLIDDPEDFSSIISDYYTNMRAPTTKKVPPRSSMYNWMENQTPMCSPTSLCSITSDL